MKVVSVNLGKSVSVNWRGKDVQTGIFKNPVNYPIVLGAEDVQNDNVIDRKNHGGLDKACYLYSADFYDYWKALYPELEWVYGMFGENITVEGLDETKLRIGEIYQLGNALIQISQPRQPCFKLGIRFGNQKVLKDFIHYGHPGTYVRILTPGQVDCGDHMILKQTTAGLTVLEIFSLLYHQQSDEKMVAKALSDISLAASAKAGIAAHNPKFNSA